METFKRVSGGLVVLMSALTFAFPVTALAATSPSLGAASTLGVLSGTFTPATGTTAITGDLGYTTLSAGSYTVTGSTFIGGGAGNATYVQAETDANTALTSLNSQTCPAGNNLGVIVDLSLVHGAVYTPGVYCTTGAMSIATGGITLSGAGTYIFRSVGALTTVDNSNVVLANGASSCDVFWAPTAATTLGANTTFMGTLIDNQNAITVGANTAWIGRALSLQAGTVTTHTGDTINSICTVAASTPVGGTRRDSTINVVKVVVNDNGGTKTVADFPLFINGTQVTSGATTNFSVPGGTYTVTETSDSRYTRTFSGDCDVNGQVTLNPGDNRFCIVTNNDIGAPTAPVVPPLIDVVKVPSPLALPGGPGPVMYTYTLRNIGTVPVSNVTMVGDTCSPITLISGDTNGDSKLDVNETWVYTCSTTLLATHTNTVVATGWANGISATDIASATVIVGAPIVPPLIHVTKIPSPLALSAGGGLVTYTEKITNPGTIPLSGVGLTDDKCSPVSYVSGDTNGNSMLDITETWTFTCSARLTQTTTNTATATGQANGITVRDLAIATVVVAAPGLPHAGLVPSRNTPVLPLVAAGILMVSSALIVLRKKQIA